MYKSMGLIQFIFKCFFERSLIKADLFGLKYIKTVTLWNSITIDSFDGKAEFSAAIIPVFNVTWSFRKSFWFGAQETFLIINVENSCAFQSFLWKQWHFFEDFFK